MEHDIQSLMNGIANGDMTALGKLYDTLAARLQGVPTATVKWRYRKALSQIQAYFEVYWAELLACNGDMHFDSVEKARETVPFALKNMTRLPENDGEWILDSVRSGLREDGSCGQNADITYSLDYSYADEAGWLNTGNELLSLSQRHVGPDAYIDYTTVHDIEKVMIGDIEAAAVSITAA